MLELTIALVLFLFPLAYSPGPGNLFFAANGARFGFRATNAANAGYHVATWIVTVAIGLGFAQVIAEAPALLTVVRWIGGVYVLYLAWTFLRAGTLRDGGNARPASALDGALLLILNPKAYVIIALMFSQFLIETDLDRTRAVLWISTVFTLNNLVAFLVWIALGDLIAALFRDASAARRLNTALGLTLAGVAVWMLLG